jgi:hypothetical protein
MSIEIHNPLIEARLQKQVERTGSGNVEEALLRILETQEEQDRWLAENRAPIAVKIQCGLDQLDRGEGIPENHVDAYLAKLKANQE